MKKDTVSKWKYKLDIIFSQVIKERNCINGKGQCFTCYKLFPKEKLQAGHYRRRELIQCAICNGFNQGEQWIFGNHLDEKYGEGTALRLLKKSHEIKQFTVPELKTLYEFYKAKLETLRQEISND